MKIVLGADHAGFELKEKIRQHLLQQGMDIKDVGTFSAESVDYPDYARQVGEAVAEGRCDRGILVCGTGIGMAMAANKVPGIRAAGVHSEMEAQLSREHNDANVLTLGARVLDVATATAIVNRFLDTGFAGGRHERRVNKIMEIEQSDLTSRTG
jgi:ribose 5-phosphate isomerase B